MLRTKLPHLTAGTGLARKFLSAHLFIFSLFISSFDDFKKYYWAPGVMTELRLDETSGTTAIDGSGFNHPGTLINGATRTAGKYGQAVSLNGSNQYINIADHNDFTLSPTQSYTWSAWIRNNNFNQWSTVWSQTVSSTSFFYFYAHTSNDNEAGPVTNGISVYWYNSGSNKLVLHSNNNVLTAGTWSHVTITYNGGVAQNSRFTIYVNGTDVTNRTDVVSSGTIASINPTNIRVGSNQPYGEYLNGAVDDIRYYTRLLSVAEIQNDINTGSGPDITNPTVNITAPVTGNVSGTVNITANASDDVGVSGVQFLLDGTTPIGAEDVTAPYSVSWNTIGVSNGSHTLTAVARDAAGNTATSAGIAVNVNNDIESPTVNITAPAAGTIAGTISVTATASDNFGVAGVQFLLNGNPLGAEDLAAPYSVSWNTTTVTDGNYTLTARARDAAGNLTTSDAIAVTVQNNVPDETNPTVSITAPSPGNVSGNLNVTANAIDNIGVAGVQFLLDGNPLGSEDLTAPYSISWNTTGATNGPHVLTAVARDAAGNSTTSAEVAVIVDNDVTAPAIDLTAPAAGPVSGTVSVTADASDNVGIAGVQFLLNGSPLGSEDLTAPYSVSWNTNSVSNNSYNLSARARDAAGNTTTSSIVIVNVDNDVTAPAVSITDPATGTVSGVLDVTAEASDNIGVVGVQFLLNGNPLGAEDITAPYSVSWNTTTVTDGNYNLSARARDANGNLTTSAVVAVSVKNDLTNPTVSITSPAAGNVAGTINIAASASDNIGVAGVQFLLNGNPLGVEDLSAPYSVSWNTTGVTNGSYTLTARARDASGNTGLSSSVIVNVNNTSNLVAAYGFNENTGTSANDNSGNNNHGTLTNGPTWTASGRFGSAIAFDGSNDLVNVNDANSLDLTNGMTLEAWVYPTNLTGYKTIISKERATNAFAYTLAANNSTSGSANQRPNARIRIGSNNRIVTGTSKLPLNTWTHIATTYDGAIMRLYINGVQVSTLATTGNITTTTNMLRIGGSPNLGAQYFAGRIDEVRIYNRALSAAEVQTDMNTPVAPDLVPPTVNITAPVPGNVSGIINMTATASDNIGINGVQFLLDGTIPIGAEDATAPYSVSWNTTTISNGNHIITAVARDAAGNVTTSDGITVMVNNDGQPPTVSITSPTAGDVSGTINIDATAGDNIGVAGVQFKLDGTDLGTEDVTAPYSINWNTVMVTNGNHTLTAVARDAAGNTTTSAAIIVNVTNIDEEAPAVSVTSPTGGNVSGSVNIAATASDNISVTGVQFFLDGSTPIGSEDITAPYSVSWNTAGVSNGSHTLTARARDAAGNTTTSAEVVINVDNDITAPTVSITSPTGGTVSGSISIDATAGDNIGVAGVQFFLDGNIPIGSEDVTAPYSVLWNTVAVSNGVHIITARARDAAGNTTTSAGIAVTINNIAPANLITALHLNETSGTNAEDVSGKNHPGTLSGATRTAGKYGNGVSFNGTNNYISIADHADFSLNPTQNYTWSGWVRNTNFNQWSTIWSQTLNTSTFFYFYAHSSTDADAGPVTNGISVCWFNGANKLAIHSNNNVLTTGQWSHVAITYNGSLAAASRFTIYVNGTDVTNRTDIAASGTIAAIDPTNIRIGANQPYGEYLNGAVDEIRYYNRLLSLAEILNDMNTPLGIDDVVPTVSITSPANSENISGIINITANASDNTGVAGVQFFVDGIPIGAEDLTAPYTVSWNSHDVPNGSHVLTAQVKDAAGNTATSSETIVNVIPDFSFSLLTPSKNVEQTGQTDFRIYVSYLNGYTTAGINLSVTGLPANTTSHFLFNPMSHQGETQLIVNTANTPIGSYPITLTGTSFDGITHSQQGTLVVTTAADFALTASPSIQNVTLGNSVSYTINLNETNDFLNPVALFVSGLPSGITATFNPTAPVPVTTATLTLNVSGSVVPGTYNLTVQGTSGALTRTTPITLIVTSTPSVWTVTAIASTGTQNNCIRVGALKHNDPLERVYVGTIGTGRMLEYGWNGSAWTGPVDVGGSPGGMEIHDVNIGDGRGDGKDRLYAASYDFNIYEIWHDETGWHQMTVGNLNGNLGMHMAMGDGRNDGVIRLYAASTTQLFEFTWNGTGWTKLLIGSTPGAHGVALGNARNDGKNYIYIASISSGNFEVYWNGASWVINSMGDSGDSRGIGFGDGRNDGTNRVYAAMYDGRMREFTWTGSNWTFVNLPNTGIQNVHAYIVAGRNDGVNRLYTDNGNGKVWEYTWTGTVWETYNMGGGSDYMYGLHYGKARHDGLIRLYSTDRGSVNRVYEFSWGIPGTPITRHRKDKDDEPVIVLSDSDLPPDVSIMLIAAKE